jgi:hypothetical protein
VRAAVISVEAMKGEHLPDAVPHLVTLLRDVVDAGASIGFLPPLGEAEARTY